MENFLPSILAIQDKLNPLASFEAGQQRAIAEQQQALAMQQQQAAQAAAVQRQRDVEAALANPSAAGFSDLMTRYPDQATAFKSAWEARDKAAQTADLTQLGTVIAAIDNGSPELALKSLEARIEANKAAGVNQEGATLLHDALAAGDYAKAKGIAAYMVAAVAGPEALNGLLKGGDENVVLGEGGTLVNKRTGEVVARGSAAAKVYQVEDADGNKQLVEYTPGGGGTAGKPPAPGFDAFYNGFLRDTEGGYAARDGKSGAPVNFGVNQKANPDIDVKNLTPEKAKQVLNDRYFVASGADKIDDPALQAVVADTAVNMGVGTAKAMLKASGGDVGRFLGLREAKYRSLGGPDLPAWLERNKKLASYVGLGAGAAPGSGARVVYSAAPPAEADNGLTGPAYLESLPPSKRGIVSAIVRGDFPITAKMTSPSVIKLFEAASRVDPTVSAATYPKRVATMKDFSSAGKSGQAITSIETLANHLYTLAEASDELGGTDLGGRPGNYLMNAYARQTNNKAYIKYQSAIDKIAPELDKFLSGKAATVSGQKEARDSFDANLGPTGRKQAIATTIELILGRLGPLGDAFSRGMDREVAATDLLRPDKKALVDAVTKWAAGQPLERVEAKAPAKPKAVGGASGRDDAEIARLQSLYGIKR